MSLTLLYPVRLPPLYFPSVSDRWFGEGRGGLLGLLESADPQPAVAGGAAHLDEATVEVQGVRVGAGPCVST